jgi:hypothetical protein
MQDKDTDLLFEQYRKIYEAPVTWVGGDDEDHSSKLDKSEVGRLSKYKVTDPEAISSIINAVKEFLQDHENSHYPGTYKDFRKDIQGLIASAGGINKTNAGYVSRVIQNALRRLKLIDVSGDQVIVKDVDNKSKELDSKLNSKLGGKKDAVEAIEDTPAVTKFSPNRTYVVSVLEAGDITGKEQELLDYIHDEGMTGKEIMYTLSNTLIWRNAYGELNVQQQDNKLIILLGKWVKAGVLQQKAEDTSDRELTDPETTDHNPDAPSDYLKDIGADVPTADDYSGSLSNEW